MVNVTGLFISNSEALSYFVVLQCDYDSPDVFRVLYRDNISMPANHNISAPPSTYTVYAFDLWNGSINNIAAAIQHEGVKVENQTSKLHCTEQSMFLQQVHCCHAICFSAYASNIY